MFKFGFFEDKSSTQEDAETNGNLSPLSAREHPILDSAEPPPQDEIVPLSICGSELRLLNGDRVTARLERTGAAGDLIGASQEHTDLVPDVYEGGMKLWECSKDLVQFLDDQVAMRGLHVTELGCGAALPALFCLLHGAATVCVQDYNREVVDHLTLPNLRLNVPAERLSACRAFSGDWGRLAPLLAAEGGPPPADLLLTAETIYSRGSWRRLLRALDAALAPHGTALVAAKTMYFGVGGGTRAFEVAVQEDGRFRSEVVFSTEHGLRREILRLRRS